MRDIVAVLHNIRSIHNVGSIFRTADGAGISKLYLCGITPTPLDRFGKLRLDFKKVALGAEKTVLWEYVSTTGRAVKKLKEKGYTIVSVEQSAHSVDFIRYKQRKKKIAFIVGNEVRGLTPSILKKSDVIIEIPMRGAVVRQAHHPRWNGRGKESLNVSVAFGIVAYHLSQ